MTLAQYLNEHAISDADFAVKIGVNRSTVSRLRRGDHTGQLPSRATIEAIAKETNGAVTANDFWLQAA